MNSHKVRIAALVSWSVVIWTLLVVNSSAQTTLHVPGDQPTIQAAINAAADGDTVVVAPGTYVENINFEGKAITVTSSAGPAVTTIDGGANGSVVTFNSGETTKSVLNGFTIRNGSTYYAAGGIQITSSSPTITGNVITANHSPEGIGINIYGGSPQIKNNTITGNTQIGSSGGGGGGIYTSGTSSSPATPIITGNTITNNSVAGGGSGGGISVAYFGVPVIQDNLIQGNTAYNYGGGLSLTGYDGAIVVQNIITNNISEGGGSGGGVYISGPANIKDVLTNNTLAGNSASDNTSGVFVSGFAQTSTVSNNIIVAAPGQNAVTCSALYSPVSAVFSHNDAYSSGGQAWSGICDSTSNPNISVDPQFVNVGNGMYEIEPTSPAVDAGDNSAQNLPTVDLAGNPRILDGNNDCVSTIDIGAYEFMPGAANASFSSASLAFPDTILGSSSSAATVTLTNTGAACFQFSSNLITGDFSEANNCLSAGVPGGSSCVYSVIFTPTASGTRSGTLSASGSDGITPEMLSVALSGHGLTPPAVSLSPSSLSFADQLINTTSVAQPIVVTNTGNATLSISGIAVTGPFSLTNNCGTSLAGNGASCTISVTFTPTQRGAANGSVSIADNASGSPHVASLAGNGILPAAVSLSPSSLSFAAQPVGTNSPPQSITMTNAGDAGLTISGINASGAFDQANDCPPSLPGGGSCTITVIFHPVTSGAQSGSVQITDNAGGSPQNAALSGIGADFSILVSPSNATVSRGHSTSFAVTLVPVGGAFPAAIDLSCSGLPVSSRCSFSPASVTPGSESVTSGLVLSTGHQTHRGTYTISIIGTSAGSQHIADVILEVK